MLLIITRTNDELLGVSTSMTLNDLKPLKYGVLVFFAIFGCGALFKGDYDEMAGDRPKQSANKNC